MSQYKIKSLKIFKNKVVVFRNIYQEVWGECMHMEVKLKEWSSSIKVVLFEVQKMRGEDIAEHSYIPLKALWISWKPSPLKMLITNEKN